MDVLMGQYGFFVFSFIGSILLFGSILALVAKLKKRSWIGWGIAGSVVSLIPLLGIVVWLILLIVLAVGSKGEGSAGMPAGPRGVPDFNPDFQTNNIAIDSTRNKLWVRDVSGRSRVFDRSEILRWNTTGLEVSRGSKHWIQNCGIEIHVKDLAQPKWLVRFTRHGTFWISGERSNHAEMQEWYSRLTTWVNNA